MNTQLRASIRNAYFCEDLETVLAEWEARLACGQREAAKYLRELLNEAMDEIAAI